MVMPSGRRNSAPAPTATASGKAPNSAAIVVIVIGRKRARQASKIEASGVRWRWRSAEIGEIDQHDAVLLDDADEQDDADEGDDRQLGSGDPQRDQRAEASGGQGGDDRHRMDQAFVEHAQDNVDGEQCGDHEHDLARAVLRQGLGVAGEIRMDRIRHMQFVDRPRQNRVRRLHRHVRRGVVIDRDRLGTRLDD